MLNTRKPAKTALGLALILIAAGCSGDQTSAPPAGNAEVSKPGPASPASGLCSLFTKKEVEEFLGIPVEEGKVAGPLGTACQWDGKSTTDAEYAQIQVVDDRNYWEKPKLAQGFEPLTGIGMDAFVVPELGGWKAGALTDKVVMVSLNGGKSSKEIAVQVLKAVLGKLK